MVSIASGSALAMLRGDQNDVSAAARSPRLGLRPCDSSSTTKFSLSTATGFAGGVGAQRATVVEVVTAKREGKGKRKREAEC
ncbi:hypothetical protein L484_016476 [Morus notabilis]|uniref:Uncharacterized protein n=1 Tax=Morus notabilis TaxID=981085 RepID=W9QG89_9ROSA|nr:hypothetical protein L484_016476 [Morus notabilis]